MIPPTSSAGGQLHCLLYELQLIVNRRWWRWLTCWWGGCAGVLVSYRLDRFGYLLLGDAWGLVRIFLFPVFLALRALSAGHEIHYKANIGRGLKILHPSLGVVVSAHATIGTHLTLTGGNCIGGRKTLTRGDLVIGDDVELGASAVVLGPVQIGNRVTIGACALVLDDATDDAILVGVPARPLRKTAAGAETITAPDALGQ